MTTNLMRAALMIGGCTGLIGWSQPGQAQDRPPPKAPVARVCQVVGGQFAAKTEQPRTMTVSGEGGWCSFFRTSAVVVASPPTHGEVVLTDDGPWHIISYRATAHYTGQDSFEARTRAYSIPVVVNVNVVP